MIEARKEIPVGYITLCRPEKSNAYTRNMLDEVSKALNDFSSDESLRLVVIEAEGPNFCAGADKDEIQARVATDALDLKSAEVFDQLATLPKPTIAVVQGAAFGGGLEIAIACDIRVACKDARFALPETSLGIIPAAGALYRLERIVGPSVAKRMVLFGQELHVGQALACGLVDKVADSKTVNKVIDEFCDMLAKTDPEAVRLAKAALDSEGVSPAKKRLSRFIQGSLYGKKN